MIKVKKSLCVLMVLTGFSGITSVYSTDDMDKYYEGGGKSFNPGTVRTYNGQGNQENQIKTQEIKYDYTPLT